MRITTSINQTQSAFPVQEVRAPIEPRHACLVVSGSKKFGMTWKELYCHLGARQHRLGLGTKDRGKYLLTVGASSAPCMSL